jgi:hypothetical protein
MTIGPDEPCVVTVVHAPACHLCEDAEAALARLATRYSLVIDRIDIRTLAAQDLLRIHRPAMSPLVLIDGSYFSSGRLPRRKLARLLERRLVGAPVANRG